MLGHDLAADALPEGPFDVVHARLLLGFLPSRRHILGRLVEVLRPGGLLVIEEFGYAGRGEVLAGPGRAAVEIYREFQAALADVSAAAGADAGWAVDAHEAMRSAGLSEVDTVTHARSWRGGTAGCLLPLAVSTELRDQLVAVGMVDKELDRLARLLMDPGVVVMGDLLWSHLGRRPLDESSPLRPAAPVVLGHADHRDVARSARSWVNQVGYLRANGAAR